MDAFDFARVVRGQRLEMVRERFAPGGLYVANSGEDVLVSTSLARLRVETGPLALDREAAASMLVGFLLPAQSFLSEVVRVPPGHRLEVRDGSWQVTRGSDLPDAVAVDSFDRRAFVDALWRKLGEVVVAAAQGSGEVAVSLSGGVDSGALAVLAARHGIAVRTFTVAGDVSRDDADGDLARAQAIARQVGLPHEVTVVDEDDLPASFADAARAAEALLVNGRAVASLRYYQALRRAGVTTVLSGVGADEVLAGDPSALAPDAHGIPAFWRRLEPEWALAAGGLLEPRSPMQFPPPPAGVDPLDWAQRQQLATTLPELALPIERTIGAACGIDVRFPYLDPGFAELAFSLPPSLRCHGDLGKLALRDALRGLLPDDIVLRPKLPRWAPPGGATSRARARWQELYDGILSAEALARLSIVSSRWSDDCRAELASADPRDPRRAILDRTLMKLATLVILEETFR